MLDTEVYKHTLIICNTYIFSTSAMVAITLLNTKLHVYCLYFSFSRRIPDLWRKRKAKMAVRIRANYEVSVNAT